MCVHVCVCACVRVCWYVAGEAVTDEATAVTITSVPQAAFSEHVQYQFRTENTGGQVRWT